MIQKKKFSDAIAANISVVGGLIPVATIYKSGFIPAGGYIRQDLGNKWHCLFESSTTAANVVRIQSISYLNKMPVDITIRFYAYNENEKGFEYKINGTTSGTFNTKMKYKHDGTKYKVWINSKYISCQFLYMAGLSNVLVENEPDSDAIDMNGDY